MESAPPHRNAGVARLTRNYRFVTNAPTDRVVVAHHPTQAISGAVSDEGA
jgi:hypothetical protein